MVAYISTTSTNSKTVADAVMRINVHLRGSISLIGLPNITYLSVGFLFHSNHLVVFTLLLLFVCIYGKRKLPSQSGEQSSYVITLAFTKRATFPNEALVTYSPLLLSSFSTLPTFIVESRIIRRQQPTLT